MNTQQWRTRGIGSAWLAGLAGLVLAVCLSPPARAQETAPGKASTTAATTKTAAATESGEATAAASATPKAPAVVAHIHLGGAILEKPREDPFGLLAGQMTSLKSLLARLEKARKDDAVQAVVLTYDMTFLGLAQIEEIHKELLKFRKTGKPVLVQVDSTYFSVPTYALLSAASDLTVDPYADFWVTGFYAEGLYLRGLLDKIGVDADFLQFEDYKSAAEILTRTGPTEAARENMNWLLDGLYESMTGMIARSREVTTDTVKAWIDRGIHRAPEAKASGMVDAAAPREAFLKGLRDRFGDGLRIDNRYGDEKKLTVDFSSPFAFFSLFSQMAGQKKRTTRDAVALVYVEGAILPGHGQPTPFAPAGDAFANDIRHALQTATDDDRVKAVVLRVDSPGGSVLGSEVILRAVKDVRAKKPVVVSMGNVAASGGYYISCGASEIVANETTITASIGVVGGKLVTRAMWDKLGINWEPYPRGENADFFSSSHRFTEAQRQRFHDWMEDLYVNFKNHVVEQRGERLAKPIEDMAGGRVFTGRQALDLGLIDRIGGLQDALARAAELASITDYDVRIIPEPKNPIEELMKVLSGEEGERTTDLEARVVAALPPMRSPDLAPLASALQALDPARLRAALAALRHVDLLRRESAAYLLPFELVVER